VPEFDRVRSALLDGRSPYEATWQALCYSLRSEYPSSSAFVRHCWQGGRVRWLIESVVEAADRLEAVLLEIDHDPTAFEDGLEREVDFER
jgi:hypothetical protein